MRVGNAFSFGSALLWGLVEQVYEGNIQPIADVLEVLPQTVSRWLYGDARPNDDTAIRIIAPRLGIHPCAWTLPRPPRWRLPIVRRLRIAMMATLAQHPRGRMDQVALAEALGTTLDAVVLVARSLQEDEFVVVRGATITLTTSPEEQGQLTVGGVARQTGRTKQAVSQMRQRGLSLKKILATPKNERAPRRSVA